LGRVHQAGAVSSSGNDEKIAQHVATDTQRARGALGGRLAVTGTGETVGRGDDAATTVLAQPQRFDDGLEQRSVVVQVERQRAADTARGQRRPQARLLGGHLHLLLQVLAHGLLADGGEAQGLAARLHRGKKRSRRGRDQDDTRGGRRFFERLEERVLRRTLHRVRLVDNHHTSLALMRPIADGGDRLPYLFDADDPRGRGDPHDVRVDSTGDLATGDALAACVHRAGSPTVERLREQQRGGRLADSLRSGEEQRVGQAAALDGPLQRLLHDLLADHSAQPAADGAR